MSRPKPQLRRPGPPPPETSGVRRRRAEARIVLIRAGMLALRARLKSSITADRIWSTLPIYATAETRGPALCFEARCNAGREGAARQRIGPGEIAFWPEETRVVIPWATVLHPEEIALPALCNVWALALDDVNCLASVRPGESVAVLVAES